MSMAIEGSSLYQSFRDQALDKNEKSSAAWFKYKSDLDVTKSLLTMIPEKVNHDVMVPIGPKALVPGKIVHTNEFLVNLGETWFAKRSAFQAIEICDRRIKSCDEMLQKLEKERELIINKTSLPVEQEAFGSDEKPEIIEYVTEEENEEWKKQHRLREKEYRQKLAELRNREKKTIETEEDLWKHLDELELQEELEDELNKLNADCSSEGSTDEENLQSSENSNSICSENSERTKQKLKENLKVTDNPKIKRKISFAYDSNSSDDEPLILKITHSDTPPAPRATNSEEIVSPSDIYDKYLNSINRTPLSILKSDVNPNRNQELQLVEKISAVDLSEEEDNEEKQSLSTGILINDITEKNLSEVCTTKVETKNKKVSKFKASRVKNL